MINLLKNLQEKADDMKEDRGDFRWDMETVTENPVEMLEKKKKGFKDEFLWHWKPNTAKKRRSKLEDKAIEIIYTET